jgi:hypothetical protein
MIVKRGYFDFTENEDWLNEMAQDGHAMNDCRMGVFNDTFSFEKCEPGEYIFRVLVLDKSPKHPESMRYLRFLREGGAEHVGNYYGNAVYLRRKAADGPFDVYTDRDSRMKFHKRLVRGYALSFMTLPALYGIAALALFLLHGNMSGPAFDGFRLGIIIGMVIGTAISLRWEMQYIRAFLFHRRAVKRLKNEGLLYE